MSHLLPSAFLEVSGIVLHALGLDKPGWPYVMHAYHCVCLHDEVWMSSMLLCRHCSEMAYPRMLTSLRGNPGVAMRAYVKHKHCEVYWLQTLRQVAALGRVDAVFA